MRADSFFINLTKRQSMLLLVSVTFGGADALECFEFLPDDEGEVLKERAQKLMEVPREQRLPFLVQEIKRLVMGRKGGDLRGADPAQVVRALKGQRPALAEVLLRALPAALADRVRNELPPSNAKITREIKPEILSVIRWQFEGQLQKLAPKGTSFLFADLLTLSARDLLTLSDHLGADDVGPALAGLAANEREELVRTLPAEQRALATRAANRAQEKALPADKAKAMLQDISSDDPRHTVRQAGLRRLVRACLAESAEFASKLAERHRDELGRALVGAIRIERPQRPRQTADRLKADVLTWLEFLAERGLVERPVRLQPPPALRARMAQAEAAASANRPKARPPPPVPKVPPVLAPSGAPRARSPEPSTAPRSAPRPAPKPVASRSGYVPIPGAGPGAKPKPGGPARPLTNDKRIQESPTQPPLVQRRRIISAKEHPVVQPPPPRHDPNKSRVVRAADIVRRPRPPPTRRPRGDDER
jgi:hypothetical protein